MAGDIPMEELLANAEGPTLDFKSAQYRFDDDGCKARFIKDILSMANTPRDDSSYIVLGVKSLPNGRKEITGLDRHHDDANLQVLVRSKTDPSPQFRYIPVEYEGKRLALIEVPPTRTGPYVAKWEYPNVLRYRVVYWRRGSANDEAGPDEVRTITAWMLEPPPKRVEVEDLPISIPRWDEFHAACHKFDAGWLYVLVVGPSTGMSGDELAALGRVDWSLVLDFDPATDRVGTHAAAADELSLGRSVHLLTLEDRVQLNPQRASYWVAAKGLEDRPSSVVPAGWRAWNRRYALPLRDLIERFARSSQEMPITVAVLWDDAEYVRTVCEAVDAAFGDAAGIVFALSDPAPVSSVVSMFAADAVPISTTDICRGLCRSRPSRAGTAQVPQLPTLEGDRVGIPGDQQRWLEEDLDLVHLAVGQSETPGRTSGRDFLRGLTISWFELAMHRDIDRDITAGLVEQVDRDLRSRSTIRANLYHWPGAGGTTIARRIAWHFHGKYPTACLLSARGEETMARLRALFDLTKLPPLILVDGSEISMSELEPLYAMARSRQLPIVFLTALRRFDRPPTREHRGAERVSFVDQTLSIPESYRFAEAYADHAPGRRTELEAIVNRGEPWQRTPFFFGLVAFEKDFLSLEDYVSRRLATATDLQRRIVVFICMAYHYAQRPVAAQLFAQLLGVPAARQVRLERALSDPLRELLVREQGTQWRAIHDLVAREILEQVLAGPTNDRRVWVQNLSAWATDFVEVCARRGSRSDEVMDLLRRMFVLRDNQELLGTEAAYGRRYAQLVEDVPTREGKLTILRCLVEQFPGEPHFWGHLGRLYSMELQDDDRALEAIDRAIDLDPSDDVLHHMRGMALRRQAFALMTGQKTDEDLRSAAVQGILKLVAQAGDEFGKARELEPVKEHGYVSHIQLLLRSLDFGFRVSGSDTREEFLAVESTFREMVDQAESLFEELQRLRQGQEPSLYYIRCQAGLDELYGNYSRVIERWTNLLGRHDIYQPPVRRQIARAYVARRSRSWDELDERENDRILELMEQNILQEPADDRNVRFWFQAARRSRRYSTEAAIEKLSYWRANSNSIEPVFYLYILHTLQALDGSELSRRVAYDLIRECSQRAQALPNRRYSLEWLGPGAGMRRIVHHQVLGDDWVRELETLEHLALVDARVATIKGPEAGQVELSCGLRAFFVPGRGHGDRVFAAGRDENAPVRCCLAFTYDGLSAWSVREAPADRSAA